MSSIKWNPRVKLILSDVDETLADLYLPADPEMINKITKILQKEIVLFFITGQGIKSVLEIIVNKMPENLRWQILVGHCSGTEVWGFDHSGKLNKNPFYSIYNEKLIDDQKTKLRKIIDKLIKDFELKTYPTMPVELFLNKAGDDPLSIMFEDRGPQITFEMVNAYDLSDDQLQKLKLKIPNTHGHFDISILLVERAERFFNEEKLPITPRLGGIFALDFAVKGISKTTAVEYGLNNEQVLSSLGLRKSDLTNPEDFEIWGDKFSVIRGGTDRHMCEAVNPRVRTIDFRKENPEEFLKGYNIVTWDGEKHLHEGLLEYLSSDNV